MPKNHRSDAVPPAVAALLAVTSIPKRPLHSSRRRVHPLHKKLSIDQLVEEWRRDDPPSLSFTSGSPMDVLLERPDDDDVEEAIMTDSFSEKEMGAMSSRSISSDSLTSIPSLEADDQSLASWSTTNLVTPQSLRRERVVNSPPKEDCDSDHPLLHVADEDGDLQEEAETPELVTPVQKTIRSRSSFRSNLTASLQALKLAAKSFSNFTAPSIPPDDFLTRSILSPRFTSEMRPKSVDGLADAALRRYLNPLSPTELSMQIYESSEFLDTEAPMIQLQTYDRRGRGKGKRRGVSPRSEAGRALASDPTTRQREPRENSDFLRVIVMEMNMRHDGKLDSKAVGKARIWLPPRKMEMAEDLQEGCLTGARRIPARWIAVGVDDV